MIGRLNSCGFLPSIKVLSWGNDPKGHMDIQSILVDSGIAALLLIQVGRLVNGHLQRSKIGEGFGEYVSGKLETFDAVVELGHTAVDALGDNRIDREEFNAVMDIVNKAKARSADAVDE